MSDGPAPLPALLELFSERAGLVHAASAFKTSDAAVRAPARVEAVIANAREAARAAGLGAEAVAAAYREVVGLFVAFETSAFGQRAAEIGPKSLTEIRDRIDELDRRIVAALAAAGVSDCRAALLAAARAALSSRA
jgi:isochorismate pyruvate lyase